MLTRPDGGQASSRAHGHSCTVSRNRRRRHAERRLRCPAVRRKGPSRLDHGLQSRGSRDQGSPSRAQFLARRRPSRRCQVTPLVERNWQTLAACRSADPDLSFPLSSSGKSLGQVAEATRKRTPALIGRTRLAALPAASPYNPALHQPLAVAVFTNNRPYRRISRRLIQSSQGHYGYQVYGDGRQLPRLRPPSMTIRWPVMKPAPSEARKLTAWAMSPGVPIRPAGTEAR
jgi:hypothetical protein